MLLTPAGASPSAIDQSSDALPGHKRALKEALLFEKRSKNFGSLAAAVDQA